MNLNQYKTPIFDGIKELEKKKLVPLGIPGHKGSKGLPEMAEFFGERVVNFDVHECFKMLDKYSQPTGIIKEAEKLASEAYGADHAFFLINGTSSGIIAMIMSVCKPNEKIIIPRNAHKSVITALIYSGAIPVFIQPEINTGLGIAMGITPKAVEDAIKENPDAKAVLIIHSTFYGAVSDIKEISRIAHANNMAVLVDEAHGAHFKFHPELPGEAMTLGADMCAVSTHKTGGSFVQSSILLLNNGIITEKTVRTYLNMINSTSASFLLLTSLDIARKQLATEGEKILTNILEISRWARSEINKIDGLYCYGRELIGTPGVYDYDETKIGICVKNLGLKGFEVYDILLKKYNIQVAISDMYNVLAILSIGQTKENLKSLIKALKDISVKYRKNEKVKMVDSVLTNPEIILSPRDAFYSNKVSVKLDDSVGKISGETVMAYPPGIPIVVSGERLTEDMVKYISMLQKENGVLHGLQDTTAEYINIIE
ncbi:arginine decarboxylase [Clostridium carboxidivorans P7]|uniref:Orn/Lys/Arg decarboxylase major region n=1 Tax=Clostridium carboxidivorans P7 TaxID=536227 RepID=C6PRW4_9CLOT|nr:aminotransferase class V-fold PLP-dependent enzyme [Clostridium carboxidivorans]AKN30028.1 arginine decarboxylase [Clostridium carboxidivorans P7]EET88016.1 Orn/Lys/Arg decarboxylase major region [Clostridium carboxidivorans P7]EFG89028.1 Orn/Lys/Arg decarboxylase, major domain protein [Clostridium carboxidivorans P7]